MNVYETTWGRSDNATVRFTGANAAFHRLVTRGALLELVTFGFYRFWLATDIRRHLWTQTEIGGDALEYIGRGKELLLGFLVGLAILTPAFLASFLLGIAFERGKAFSSLPLYIFFYAFGQFAIYRARRYRLTRTIWRGVRFWMTGSGWAYALRTLLWMLLLIPTLGFAYPWQMAALERYKMGHTYYGNLPGRFEATGWGLFKRVWWVWLLGLLPLLIVAVPAGRVALALAHAGPFASRPLNNVSGLLLIVGMLSLIALPFLHAIRKATEWRWWTEGVRFGDVAIACSMRRSALIGVYWKLIGMGLLAVLTFGVIGVALIGFARHGRTGSAAILAQAPVWGLAAGAIWYLSLLLALGIIARIYTMQRVWRAVTNACALRNQLAAEHVIAAGEAASALGEGLADGLDFAGF